MTFDDVEPMNEHDAAVFASATPVDGAAATLFATLVRLAVGRGRTEAEARREAMFATFRAMGRTVAAAWVAVDAIYPQPPRIVGR